MKKHNPLKGLPYRIRFKNGNISTGGYRTFEAAAKSFLRHNHPEWKDIVEIPERVVDYL